ncbi:glycosyltransferase [Nonomuraea sp. NPDC050786]|uniref:glycosyltransferase family 2 protein n=1 Tax=Nonomuraea sp. NPDC050786 TaxID=3154840 RepID=UPI0033C6F7BE
MITVVIPTVGRPTLRDTLAGVGSGVPVIVVDDTPGAELSVPGPVRIVRSGGRGPAAARNAGWRAATTPWVVFLDDDVVPSPGWAEAVMKDLADLPDDVAGSQGRIEVPLPENRRPTDAERHTAGLADALWVTADMAYRRSVLESVGGFDDRFPRAYREDADLALRVSRAGHRLVKGDRVTTHPVRDDGFWASVRFQRGNADDALMRRLHGPGWREAIGGGRGRLRVHAATTAAALTALTLAATAAARARRRGDPSGGLFGGRLTGRSGGRPPGWLRAARGALPLRRLRIWRQAGPLARRLRASRGAGSLRRLRVWRGGGPLGRLRAGGGPGPLRQLGASRMAKPLGQLRASRMAGPLGRLRAWRGPAPLERLRAWRGGGLSASLDGRAARRALARADAWSGRAGGRMLGRQGSRPAPRLVGPLIQRSGDGGRGSGSRQAAALAALAGAAWAAMTAEFAWRRIAPGPRTPEEMWRMVVTSVVIPPVACVHRLRGEWRARR